MPSQDGTSTRPRKVTTADGSKSFVMDTSSEMYSSMTLTQLIRLLSARYRVYYTGGTVGDKGSTRRSLESRTIVLFGLKPSVVVLVRVSLKVVLVKDPRRDKPQRILYTLDPCFIETAREPLAGHESLRDGTGFQNLGPVKVQELFAALKSMNG